MGYWFPMGKVALSVSLAFLCCCSQSSATPEKNAPQKAPSAPKPRPKFEVKSYCGASGDAQFSASTGRKGTYFTLDVMVPLEGSETVTEAASSNIRSEKVGDKIPLRVLMTISCSAFLPDEESMADALKDRREDYDCQASYLDLAALEAGKPFSLTVQPNIERYWKIRAIAPGFSSIEIGRGQGEDLRVTGLVPFKGSSGDRSTTYNAGGAHVSWNYSVGGGGAMGSSRVELAADCPTL